MRSFDSGSARASDPGFLHRGMGRSIWVAAAASSILLVPMLRPETPYTKAEILEAAENLHGDIADLFGALPVNVFFARPEQGWSAAENVKHLIRVGMAVNLGLQTPRALLSVFGAGRQPSRKLAEVRSVYLARLSSGATAGRLYQPLSEAVVSDEAPAEARRQALLKKWLKVGGSFCGAIQAWSDADLDRFRLPHPIMGRVPLREMCLFNLLHAIHHVGIVQARLAAARPA